MVVKLKHMVSEDELAIIKSGIEGAIPKDLQIQVVISNPDVEFEILRRKK